MNEKFYIEYIKEGTTTPLIVVMVTSASTLTEAKKKAFAVAKQVGVTKSDGAIEITEEQAKWCKDHKILVIDEEGKTVIFEKTLASNED